MGTARIAGVRGRGKMGPLLPSTPGGLNIYRHSVQTVRSNASGTKALRKRLNERLVESKRK